MAKILLLIIVLMGFTFGESINNDNKQPLHTLNKNQLIDSAKVLFERFYGKVALKNLDETIPYFDLIHVETDGKEVRVTLGYKYVIHIIDKPSLYRVTLLLGEKSCSLTKFGKSTNTTPSFFIPTKESKRIEADINRRGEYLEVIVTPKHHNQHSYQVETYTTGGKGSFLLDKKTLTSSNAYSKSRTLESIQKAETERSRWIEIK